MALPEIKADCEKFVRAVKPEFLDDPDYDKAVEEAIEEHSGNRPKRAVVEVTSNGVARQGMPTGWEAGFSKVREIEYPTGKSPKAVLIDGDDWKMVEEPATLAGENVSVEKIAFTGPPSTGQKYWVAFGRRHVVTAGATTLSVIEESAVAHLAASKAHLMLAARFGFSNDPNLTADSVNYDGKMPDFRDQADRERTEYENMLVGTDRIGRATGEVVRVTSNLPLERRLSSRRFNVRGA